MAADFNKPTVTSPYTSFPTEVRDLAAALAKMDFSGASNVPTGAIQFDGTNYELEKKNGGGTYDPLYQRNIYYGGVTAGTTSAYTLASISPALPSNLGGAIVWFYANATCADSPTLSVSGQTARALYEMSGRALIAGQIQSGQRVGVIYDETNNRWVVITPLYSGPFTWAPTGQADQSGAGFGTAWTSQSYTKAEYYVNGSEVYADVECYGHAASGPFVLQITLPSNAPCNAQNYRGMCALTDSNTSLPYNIAGFYAINNGGFNVYKAAAASFTGVTGSGGGAGFAGRFKWRRT